MKDVKKAIKIIISKMRRGKNLLIYDRRTKNTNNSIVSKKGYSYNQKITKKL